MRKQFLSHKITIRRLSAVIASHTLTGAVLIAGTGYSHYTLAQSDKTETTETAETTEKITILGTRVAGRTATESSSPIDIIQSDELYKSGFSELGQSLQAIAPSFNFSRTQVSNGSDLFRPATLRGLQPDQTLVLINGKRRHNQSIFQAGGTVGEGAAGTDMNSIPLGALKRVEVLRDGAAAQYGSDAIAGVINLELKDTVDLTTISMRWGETSKGDGENMTLGINTGVALGTDGGFLNLTAEYRDSDRTNRADNPAWHQGDAESEFTSFFYNAMIPVGRDGELYSFGGYSERTALGSGFYRSATDNNNVSQVYPDGFLPGIDNTAQDTSFAFGYRHELNKAWSMDASVVYGKNTYDFDSSNTINSSIAAEYLANNPAATDADIAANAGPTEGYSGGIEFDQMTVNFDLAGSVDLGMSSELYIGLGAEYRDESYNINQGELNSYSCGLSNSGSSFPAVNSPTTAFAACGFQAYPGLQKDTNVGRDSVALYVDLEQNLSIDWLMGLAIRYEDFDLAGSETIGKLSSRYDLTDNFAIRGAISTGFRAPSLQQTAYTAISTTIDGNGLLGQVFVAATGDDFPSTLGVENLKSETSQSLSFGIIWSPVDSVNISLDTYHIKIDDRITLGQPLTTTDVAFNPSAVASLQASGANSINFFSNAANTTTTGVDLITTYNTVVAGGELKVTFAGNINETELDRVNAPSGISESIAFSSVSRSLLEGGQPQEKATLSFDWVKDDWSSILRLQHFGETEVDYFAQNHIPIPNTQKTSVVEAATLVDLNIGYQASENLTLSVGVNNIFDETPDELENDEVLEKISGGAFRFPLRAVPYGFNGTSYYVSVNFSF